MKTCQNCKARSKDAMIECVHCGTLFDGPSGGENTNAGNTMFGLIGSDLQAELRKMKEDADAEAEVKKTLFGIPAQKVEDLLGSGREEDDKDLPKKTMAGFNVSGLFSDFEEKKEKKSPVQNLDGNKTMAGLNVGDLFSDERVEPKADDGDFVVKQTMAGVNVADLLSEEEERRAPKKNAEKKEAPQFGTMLGINVADVMAAGKTEPTASKTLFSIPVAESPTPEKGRAPKRQVITGPKRDADTAAGGVRAAVKTSDQKPAKISLGAILPKVSLHKKSPKTLSSEKQRKEKKALKTPTTAGSSGIFRKSKRSTKKENKEKKASGVVGSFVVGKDTPSPSAKEENGIKDVSPMDLFPGELLEESEIQVPVLSSIDPQVIGNIDSSSEMELDDLFDDMVIEEEASPVVHEQSDSLSVPLALPEETPENSEISQTASVLPVKDSEAVDKEDYDSSISKMQSAFVVSAGFIIIGTNIAFFLKGISSWVISLSGGISVLCLLIGIFALMRKESKAGLFMLSALLLFVIGLAGGVLATPLALLFGFAGVLFLLTALFPKIASKL